ncbi:MAG: hypothetical protein WCA09_08175 [Burkholderiales bacterium]
MSAKSAVRACQAILLVAGISLGLTQARAAGHVTQTTLFVQAAVKPSVVLRLEHFAAQVSITQADIARGYVDLPESSLLSVNAGFLKPVLVVDFSPSGSAFSSVEVRTADVRGVVRRVDVSRAEVAEELNALPATGSGRPGGPGAPGVEPELRSISSVDDALRMAAAYESGTTTLISYRFRLANGVRPGTYPVPMTVNVGL